MVINYTALFFVVNDAMEMLQRCAGACRFYGISLLAFAQFPSHFVNRPLSCGVILLVSTRVHEECVAK